MAVLSSADHRPRRRAGCRCWLWLAALALAAPAAHAQVDEAALKAAFVYNIIAFSSWHKTEGGGALVVCSATTDSLDAALAALAGRKIGQRRISVRRGNSGDAGCDVLVQTSAAAPTSAAATATLVICDGCLLPDGTSMVSLVREGSRVRFDVDPHTADKASIQFSSQLLRLARRVL